MAKKATAKSAKAKKGAVKAASRADDVRGKSADELSSDLTNLKKEQFNLRFQAATGQIEKTHRVNEIRKDIARVKTVMRAKTPAA